MLLPVVCSYRLKSECKLISKCNNRMTALTGSRFNPVQCQNLEKKNIKAAADPAFCPFSKVTAASENEIGEVLHKVGYCKKVVAK